MKQCLLIYLLPHRYSMITLACAARRSAGPSHHHISHTLTFFRWSLAHLQLQTHCAPFCFPLLVLLTSLNPSNTWWSLLPALRKRAGSSLWGHCVPFFIWLMPVSSSGIDLTCLSSEHPSLTPISHSSLQHVAQV